MDFAARVLEKLATARPTRGISVIGVSGFGGSGKSTLAAALADVLHTHTVSTDEFATEAALQQSDDWNGIDRGRLVRQILAPLRQGQRQITYDSSGDWSKWSTESKTVDIVADYFIVEGVGLFHPDVLPYLGFAVWIDADPAESTRHGLARDARAGHDDRSLWDDVWAPNDQRFARAFDPHSHADLILDGR